ncbi:ATP-binding protein [Paraglaciecola aestuariivivens]
MARLFISLYLFIALALVGLSAALDQVFFNQNDFSQTQILKSALESLNQQPADLLKAVEALPLSYQLLSPKDIAWTKEQLNLLNDGRAIVVNDADINQHIYLLHQPQQLLAVTVPLNNLDNQKFMLYSLIFFVLLGCVIALWIWPLWRDLRKLEQCTSNVLPDGSLAKNTIGKASLIYPIAQSINNMSQQISQLIKSQKELSGAVTHEFRTPLARLKFALAMQPSAQSATWQDMQKDVNELEQLVQEMLDYASTDAQIPEMNLSEIPIKRLCQQLIERLKTQDFTELTVTVSGDDAHVLADEHFIERAIQNLVVNAQRYAHSTIKLHITQLAKEIEISVEDDGEGVSQAMREKVFSAFFRPDESRDRQKGGAGLGLAIVKKIIDWHQGRCYVTDSSLGGAKFVIALPNPF